MKHCKNCGTKLTDRYCAHCGQAAKVERITGGYISHALFHFFTHIEHGFLHTSWSLVRRPGSTVLGFIQGQRKPHQPPISYFLIWTTLYILSLFAFERLFGENAAIDYKEYFGPAATTRVAISNLSMVLTIVVPFQAFYLMALMLWGTHNYFESIVVAIYAIGTVILFQFVFAWLAAFLHLATGKAIGLGVSDVFKGLYLAWFAIDLVRQLPLKWKWLRAAAFMVLALGTFTVWRLYGVPRAIEWLHLGS